MAGKMEPELLEVGTDAPDFTLASSLGDPFTLSELRGRKNVCLIFYAQDGEGEYVRRLGEVVSDRDRFIAADVERVGINPGSLASQRRFAESQGMDIPLLVDADLAVARLYGAAEPGGDRVLPAVYLVDRGGKIVFAARGHPKADRVLGALEE